MPLLAVPPCLDAALEADSAEIDDDVVTAAGEVEIEQRGCISGCQRDHMRIAVDSG
jgi:hypothetical protein